MNTQTKTLREFFESRPYQAITLSEIMDVKTPSGFRIANYGARISELRQQGMVIENKKDNVGKQIFSTYRYIPKPVEDLFDNAKRI